MRCSRKHLMMISHMSTPMSRINAWMTIHSQH